ncbi:MAG: flagellar type III secretion system pore protein FliP [Acidimicrobiia bacterium]|nr:flagellar type III secretion system pore protein FliP [Acidimicrobiia bacterium]
MRRASRSVLAAAIIGMVLFSGAAADAQSLEPDAGTQQPVQTFIAQIEEPEVVTTTTTTTQPPLIEVPEPDVVPDIAVSIESDRDGLSNTVLIILLLTIGSVAPAILLLMTSFTRFIVVLALTRNAIGVQTIPPSQVLIGLAIFLTVFAMGPVFSEVNEDAVQPLLRGEIGQSEAMEAGYEPLREFMLAQTRPEDLRLFMDLSNQPRPENESEVAASTLIPAFVISELRTAFIIGFMIFVPFLVIDLIVAAVLMSMGMVMLPPVFISLPLKLLLFVLLDGWALLIGSVVESVQGAVA